MPPGANAPARTDAVLARLTSLHPKLIDLSLDRLCLLLQRLGHPERRLPPVIHVAGTNGKGSLVAYMRAMLEAAGYRVHVYTSPHLVRFNERIRLAGRIIEDAPLVEALETVERYNGSDPITFFEATTAAAFVAFAGEPADAVLLETGMGGRFDATNVIERPALTAITPVALDHMEFLGHDLTAIAGEKAGILKPGVPAVLGPQMPEAAARLAAEAAKLSAPLFRHGEDWQVAGTADHLAWRADGDELDLPLPALAGTHQIVNAGTAIACMRKLAGFRVDRDALAAGLTRVEWPARLQRLTHGPLPQMLPPGAELWLDGMHNPHCAMAVARTLADWRAADSTRRPLWLVIAAKANKDLGGILAALATVTDGLYGVAIPEDDNCFAPADIAAIGMRLGLPSAAAASVEAALAAILAANEPPRPPPRILICGSLYLAGTVLAENG
ncbi:MAG TPA: folylpolyglutamate synthase/dihydrofolate synthase family protein [Candidatus Sulfotelmatobacter sp.]|nr:folylpolyglutamate synthase/dihydrofolate synthase family protein [Candidatus Sulfotelmatobacter sp.]